ncbi:cupin [Nordella sp. HKS 07]|uniref:cupin n=1 Tax=Nordella sp. HKS 07 TaxID=2712222 RepID=UPI0013E1F135|nr:cupin [Nordella sp. HKS 07]QIG49301.1 cupin [Nordella sp. HKS 07]
MSINKEHKEFHALDMADGWHVPPGYPDGIEQKILSGGLDEAARSGHRTRLLRFLPGAFTTRPFVHDYWEEVYLLAGDLIVADATDGGTTETFAANTYACRPPGVEHGPFRSQGGCLLLETHYYADGPT